MLTTAEALCDRADLAGFGKRLAAGVLALEGATDWILANPGPDALAGASAYLKLFGDVAVGWALGRQALLAAESREPWLQAKTALARFYGEQVLSGAHGAAEAVRQGAGELAAITPEQLGA